eukprot:7590075-Pyramimonas_sp.AAC.1
MPVDPMTKADLGKSNAAQFALLRSGMLKSTSEQTSLDERRRAPQSKARSHAASLRQLASQAQDPVSVDSVSASPSSSLGSNGS